VFLKRDAKFCGTASDVVTVDSAGESLVLQFLFHGVGFKVQDALRGADIDASGDKTDQLIAGEKRVF